MLTLSGDQVLRDGSPHLIVSGAVHYGRVHPGHWRDRLRRVRAMGCNTLETYVPWNLHAPSPDTVDLEEGVRDLGRFLDLAAEADLDLIVRPGPYICAEWEGGGLPGWLLADGDRRALRTSDPGYLAHVDAWFDQLLPVITRRQPKHGGRVVLVQVENEYGSFGDDAAYLEHLRDGLLARGVSVPLVTSDGPGDQWLLAGAVEGALPTINFGSRAQGYLDQFRRSRPGTPAMCMEFWNGWFDHWGEAHHVRDPEDAAAELATMLDGGMHVNFYMAHGGTNFGLWNGCNHDQVLQPTVTSYDYDSPIAENGALTPKFHAFREVIGRHLPLPEIPKDLAAAPSALAARELPMLTDGVLGVEDLRQLAEATVAGVPGLRLQTDPTPAPPTFEDLGLERGLLLLRSEVDHPGGTVDLRVHGLRDRAHVFLDGRLVGIAERDEAWPEPLALTAEPGRHRLDLLVESQGRINFGPLLGEHKGVTGGVWLGTRYVLGWRAYPLALDLIGAELAQVCRAVADRGQAGAGSSTGHAVVDGSSTGHAVVDRTTTGHAVVDGATTGHAVVDRTTTGHAVVDGTAPAAGDGLAFAQFALSVADAEGGSDAFVDPSSRGRGFLLVDDVLLGRYWQIGPQRTLYCPGPLLPAGEHVLTVLDTDRVAPGAAPGGLALRAEADLGPVQRFVPEG